VNDISLTESYYTRSYITREDCQVFAQGILTESKSQNPAGRVLVFIPSYNDSAALPRLVSDIRRLGDRFQPLVVDDGSATAVMTDLQADDCLYAKLSSNFGLGVCTQIAFRHVLDHGYAQ